MKLLKKTYNFYRKKHPIIRFGINGLLVFIVWSVFYGFLRHTSLIASIYEVVSIYFTDSLLYVSKWILELMNYSTYIFVEVKTLQIHGTRGVRLDLGCLGRNLMGLFAGFIIAFPGQIKTKLWYIPLGLAFIYFINVLRICALSISLYYNPESYFKYNHHDIFKYTVYAIIFLMWTFWIKRFGLKSKNE